MTKNAEGVLLKKSKLTTNGKPNLPAPSKLVEGEIAINYAEGVETISTINSVSGIVTFSSDEYYTKQKLGDYFTGENSAKTVTDVMIEKERVTAEALIDLDSRKVDFDDIQELWYKGSDYATGAVKLYEGSTASGNYAVSEGQYTTASGQYSHAEGSWTTANTTSTHAEGYGTKASGSYAHAEGYSTTASGQYSHAEGQSTTASITAAHAEGYSSKASGAYGHAEGQSTSATSNATHAEGYYTLASGTYAHAEGLRTSATNSADHAEGSGTTASGGYAHAEGQGSRASHTNAHAEGYQTSATSYASHSEGYTTKSSGGYAHAEGYGSIAIGQASHAEGSGTTANNKAEHASGRYNVSSSASTTWGDSGNTLFSVGNGTADNARHNAFEIRQNGDIYIINKDGNDVRLQDEIGNVEIDVDQVLDATVSASTNPIASQAVYGVFHEYETVVAAAINDLKTIKVDTSAVTQTIDSTTSASTNPVSVSAVYGFVTSYTPSITVDQTIDSTTSASTNPVATSAVFDFVTASTPTVDQVLDDTTSASTNPVATKAVYDVIVDNEMVWANAYVAISGAISSHTEDTDVHLTLSEKEGLAEASTITSISGYQIASTAAAIDPLTDTLLQAIAKLEKRIYDLEHPTNP